MAYQTNRKLSGTLRKKCAIFINRFFSELPNQIMSLSDRKQAKLSLLKKYALIVVSNKNQKRFAKGKRYAFTAQKQEIWARLHKACFCCERPANHRHHIIQLQNGGTNQKHNIVPLCFDCHAAIHPWMKNSLNGTDQGSQIVRAPVAHRSRDLQSSQTA